MLAGLKQAGVVFDSTSPGEWLKKVQESVSAKEEDPSRGMLPLWFSAVSHSTCVLCIVKLISSMADLHKGPQSRQYWSTTPVTLHPLWLE